MAGEWMTESAIAKLRKLWDEGHSTNEIGRRLGVSKNTVVGKAHRLDLAARPSPIRRSGEPTPYVRRMLPVRTIPKLPSETNDIIFAGVWITPERIAIMQRDWPTHKPRSLILEDMAQLPGVIWSDPNLVTGYARNVLHLRRPDDFVAVRPHVAGTPKPVVTRQPPRPVVSEAPRIAPAVPKPYARTTECVFPIGDPGTPGFRFCDVPHQNKSYCNEHESICWHKVRDRREDSAGHVAPVHSRFSLVGGGRSGFVQRDWDETR